MRSIMSSIGKNTRADTTSAVSLTNKLGVHTLHPNGHSMRIFPDRHARGVTYIIRFFVNRRNLHSAAAGLSASLVASH